MYGPILFAALLMQAPPARPVDDLDAARILADRREWDEALSALARAGNRCPQPPGGKECLGRVNFMTGYVLASRAAADEGRRDSLLQNAARAYSAAEEAMPRDAAVLRNHALVLAQMGQWSAAVEKLSLAAKADSAQGAMYYFEAAEVCRDSRRDAEAIPWYRRAAESGAGEKAWPRLISLLGETLRLDDLLKLGNDLRRHGHVDLARSAYGRVVLNAPSSARELGEQALVEWIDASAQLDTFDRGSVPVLSQLQWQSPAIRELLAVIENPDAQQSWWRNTRLRDHVWSAGLAALAETFIKEDRQRAARYYERAIEHAPYPPEYDFDETLQGRPVIFLDAAVQLARLFSSSRELDPGGGRFAELENQLFNGKALGYRMKNLAATQKTHAVLGLIYAERGKWSGGQYTNATAQLQLALEEARELEKQDGVILPLPHLNELLAGGYEKQGNTTAARKQFIAAAKSYLDVDAIDRAAGAIEKASRPAGAIPDPLEPEITAVRTIARFRKGIATLPVESIEQVAPPALSTAGDEAFAARQRFKILADAAKRAEDGGRQDVSRDLYLRAFDSVKDQKGLAGTGDVLRLNRIQGLIEKTVDIDTKNLSDAGEKVWKVPDSSSAAPSQKVAWSPDLMLAARVAAVAEPDADLKLTVRNAEVVVAAPPEKSDAAQTAANRLKASGLTRVSTEKQTRPKQPAPTPP